MAHIHTDNGQHDLTVSAYIIRTDFERPKLILHRHKKLNTLLQFGGHVELSENPWQALEHEIKEESGYELDQLKLLQPADRMKELAGPSILHYQPAYINTHPIDTGDLRGAMHYHIDMGYVFVAEGAPKNAPAKGESSDFILVDREELQKLPASDIGPAARDICLYVLDVCLPKWERVGL